MRGALLPRKTNAPLVHGGDNRLLLAIAAEDFAPLQRHIESVELSAGTVLYEPGNRLDYAYFPHECVISLLAVLEDGGSTELAAFGCEGVAGYASSLVTHESFARYVVRIPGAASRIRIEPLLEAVEARVQLRNVLMRYAEAVHMQTLQNVACNALHTLEARCCRWILSTQDRVNRPMLPLTHELLAETLGVRRATVSNATLKMQSLGGIRQHRSGITITDRKVLEAMSCECYGVVRRVFERLLPDTYS